MRGAARCARERCTRGRAWRGYGYGHGLAGRPLARRQPGRVAGERDDAAARAARGRARLHVRGKRDRAGHRAGRHGRYGVLSGLARLRQRPARPRDRRRLAAGARARSDRRRAARSDPRRRLSACADLRRARPDRADDPVPVQPERVGAWRATQFTDHAIRLDARDLPHDRRGHGPQRARASGRSAARRGHRPQRGAGCRGGTRWRTHRAAAGSRAAGPLLGLYGQQHVGGPRACDGACAVAEHADARGHAVRDVRRSAETTRSRRGVRHRERAGRTACGEARFAGVAVRARAARAPDRARRTQHMGLRRPDVGAQARRRDDRHDAETAGRALTRAAGIHVGQPGSAVQKGMVCEGSLCVRPGAIT
ncbi:hypothetical protein BVI1335_3150005 [Burkholderia vietnamiensis]|nr:hypothetical protein BVI1335_3150005 [Burkholderia vietnamiensis]